MKLSEYLPTLTSKQIALLEELADHFLEWNKKINLSAIRDRDGVMVKHILDSLLSLPFSWIQEGDRVLDLGTGGGFPGLALAIAYPQAQFTLIDATEKKIKAVEGMVRKLGLLNIRCLVGRAEKLGRDHKLREQFDVVVARALAPFPTLLEYALPFVKVGGIFIAYEGKAETWEKYHAALHELSAEIVEVRKAILPVEEAERNFVVVKKISPIDERYPRRTGVPLKRPLNG